ncbi:hypothetical protein LP420_07495 [Massilia sp. B-10]|nr:hypothetical protein LP420_07495 [Massilia sp. B-10]
MHAMTPSRFSRFRHWGTVLAVLGLADGHLLARAPRPPARPALRTQPQRRHHPPCQRRHHFHR